MNITIKRKKKREKKKLLFLVVGYFSFACMKKGMSRVANVVICHPLVTCIMSCHVIMSNVCMPRVSAEI